MTKAKKARRAAGGREPDIRLRARRQLELKTRGITQGEVAAKADVTEGLVSLVFAGVKTSDNVMLAAHLLAKEKKVDPLPARLFPTRSGVGTYARRAS